MSPPARKKPRAKQGPSPVMRRLVVPTAKLMGDVDTTVRGDTVSTVGRIVILLLAVGFTLAVVTVEYKTTTYGVQSIIKNKDGQTFRTEDAFSQNDPLPVCRCKNPKLAWSQFLEPSPALEGLLTNYTDTFIDTMCENIVWRRTLDLPDIGTLKAKFGASINDVWHIQGWRFSDPILDARNFICAEMLSAILDTAGFTYQIGVGPFQSYIDNPTLMTETQLRDAWVNTTDRVLLDLLRSYAISVNLEARVFQDYLAFGLNHSQPHESACDGDRAGFTTVPTNFTPTDIQSVLQDLVTLLNPAHTGAVWETPDYSVGLNCKSSLSAAYKGDIPPSESTATSIMGLTNLMSPKLFARINWEQYQTACQPTTCEWQKPFRWYNKIFKFLSLFGSLWVIVFAIAKVIWGLGGMGGAEDIIREDDDTIREDDDNVDKMMNGQAAFELTNVGTQRPII